MISDERLEHLKGCVENLAKTLKWESVDDAMKLMEVHDAMGELIRIRKKVCVPEMVYSEDCPIDYDSNYGKRCWAVGFNQCRSEVMTLNYRKPTDSTT